MEIIEGTAMCIVSCPETIRTEISFKGYTIIITKVDQYTGGNHYRVTTMSVIRESDRVDVTSELVVGREVVMESGVDLYELMQKIDRCLS